MQTIEIELTPEQYSLPDEMRCAVAQRLHCNIADLGRIQVLRRSLDSRRRQVIYHTTLQVCKLGEEYVSTEIPSCYCDCRNSTPIVIVGAGPAGIFAALHALEVGLRPIIVERGRRVDERKRDIALMVQSQQVNPNSNWCFGEGGAGTYSDGKLYTRSTKRGNVGDVLKKFVEHGANADIVIDAHAHIGTDCLSGIISNMRSTIEQHGGEYHFESRVVDLLVVNGDVKGVCTDSGETFEGCAVLLATGHSAHDIYELFHSRGWALEAKPFAMGVRVEHPQQLINNIQYHSSYYSSFLPPATYSLNTQVANSQTIKIPSGGNRDRVRSVPSVGSVHGVFSFCMCPGGVIVPSATAKGQQVVNGMSNSHRNSPFANSGIAVTVGLQDVPEYMHYGALALLRFQQDVERKTYEMAHNSISAPAQRLTDFCEGRVSTQLNKSNYMGTCVSAPLHEFLPPFIVHSLQRGFRNFDLKMHGFYTAEASVFAVESRTSSPVRIPRGIDYQHPQLHNLYPCGEGAGYAGGIVSSAIDGMNCVNQIAMINNILSN